MDEVGDREKLALIILVDVYNELGMAPSARELMDGLNAVLPQQSKSKPAIVSTEQVQRTVEKLRTAGLVRDPVRAQHRNFIPTDAGKRKVKAWADDKLYKAWMKNREVLTKPE